MASDDASSAATRSARPTASASRNCVAQGYDPEAGVRLWEGMLREEDARDYGKPHAGVLHPPADARAPRRSAGGRRGRSPIRPARLGAPRIARRRARSCEHWLEDELTPAHVSPARSRCIGDLQAGAAPEDAGLLHLLPRRGLSPPRQGGRPRAARAKLYAQAIAQPGAPAEAWREHGLALRAAGERARRPAAVAALPGAGARRREDLAFVTGYLSRTGGAAK